MSTCPFSARAAAVLLALSSTAAFAAPVFTTNLAAFTAANPGLTVEGFENANLASGADDAFVGPLNSATNNARFAAGSVAAGFSISAPTSNSIYVSRDFGGNAGANVSSNSFNENLNIAFVGGITAIGIDLLQWQGNNGGWAIEVYDAADNLLGAFATAAGSFVGVVSDVAIARMFLDKPNTGAVIDNLRFGTAGSAVPTPGSLALVSTAVLALGLAGRRRRGGV
jgi:hypothetical protein